MEAAQLVLPTIATLALGTALLMPLRDDRRGKRATLGGVLPLRPDFRAIDPGKELPPEYDPSSLAGENTTGDVDHEPYDAETEPSSNVSPGDVTPVSKHSIAAREQSQSSGATLAAAAKREASDFAAAAAQSTIPVEMTSAIWRRSRVASTWQRIHTALFGRATLVVYDDAANATRDAAQAPTGLLSADSLESTGPPTIERSFASELGRLLGPDMSSSVSAASAETPAEPASATVVARIHSGLERVVPLTRLPLPAANPQGYVAERPRPIAT